MDADDAEFAATQKIGNRIHALAQAEAVFDSLVEPPPHIRRQLEVFKDGLLDAAD
ncbi:hypothetical protein SAMN04488550_0142 [Gordonia malaquae]|uniref:Uncharacterized protein n=2 Tax=Gordonia TaxID=2053 RepID=M3VH20_GORML|nr:MULTISPECIES: hypothetical protein [Gordonia]GAC81534.1 hypothetical protein GM1_037_00050 [Gordonia malaquae NBRC 108250]GEE00615.1 hypothetical protein nbrc107696_10610 [Gordonia spumicola]SEB48946.1 hypothetical protein SAMN04488550_0142 [Gordonia malaquae]